MDSIKEKINMVKEFVVAYSSDPRVKELSDRQEFSLSDSEHVTIQKELNTIMVNHRDDIAAKYGRLYEIPTNKVARAKLRRQITNMPEFDTIAKVHRTFSIPAADGDVKYSKTRKGATDCTEDATETCSGASPTLTADKQSCYFRPISPDHQPLNGNCKQVRAVKPVRKTPKRRRLTKPKNSKTEKQITESKSDSSNPDFDSFMAKARKILSYRPPEEEVSSKVTEKALYNSPGDIGDKTSVMDMVDAVLNDKPSEVLDTPSTTIPIIYVSHDPPYIAEKREVRNMKLIKEIKASLIDVCDTNRAIGVGITDDSISRIPENYSQQSVPSLKDEERQVCISQETGPQLICELHEKDSAATGSPFDQQSSPDEHTADLCSQRGMEASYCDRNRFDEQFIAFVDKLTSVIHANLEKTEKCSEVALDTSDIPKIGNASRPETEFATLADMISEKFQQNRYSVKSLDLKTGTDFGDWDDDLKNVNEKSLSKSPIDDGCEQSVMDMIAAVMCSTPSDVQNVTPSPNSSDIIVNHSIPSTVEFSMFEEMETIEDMKTFLANLPIRTVSVDNSTTEDNIPQTSEKDDQEPFEALKEVLRQDCLEQGMRPEFIGDSYITKLAKARLTSKEIMCRKPEPRVKNEKPVHLDTDLMYAVRQSVKRSLPKFTGKNSTAAMMLMADGMFQEMSLDRKLDDLAWPYDPLAELKESGLALVDYMDPIPEEKLWEHLKKELSINNSKPLKGNGAVIESNLDIRKTDQEVCSGVYKIEPSSALGHVSLQGEHTVHKNSKYGKRGNLQASEDDGKINSVAPNGSSGNTAGHPSLDEKDNKEPSILISKPLKGQGVVTESNLHVGKIGQEVCFGVYKIKPSSALGQVSVQHKDAVHENSKHGKTGNLEVNEDDGKMCAFAPEGSSGSIGDHPSLDDKDNTEPSINHSMPLRGKGVLIESSLEIGKIDQDVCSGVYKIKPSSALHHVSLQEDTVHDIKHGKTGNLQVSECDGKMCSGAINRSSDSTEDHPSLDDKDNKEPSFIIPKPVKGENLVNESKLDVSKIDQEVCSGVYKIKPSSARDQVSAKEDTVQENSKHGKTGNLEVSESDGRMCSFALNRSSGSTGDHPSLDDKDNKERSFKIPKPVKEVDVVNESKLDVDKIDQEMGPGVYKIKRSSALDQVSAQEENTAHENSKHSKTGNLEVSEGDRKMCAGALIRSFGGSGHHPLDHKDNKEPSFKIPKPVKEVDVVNESKLDVGKIDQEVCSGVYKIKPSSALDHVSAQEEDAVHENSKHGKRGNLAVNEDDGKMCAGAPKGSFRSTGDHPSLDDKDNKELSIKISMSLKGKGVLIKSSLEIGKTDQEVCSGVYKIKPSSALNHVSAQEEDAVHDNSKHGTTGNLKVREGDGQICSDDRNRSSGSTGAHPSLDDKDNKEPSFKIPKPVKGIDVVTESKLDVGKIDQEVCSGVYKIKPSSALDQVSAQEEDSVHDNSKDGTTGNLKVGEGDGRMCSDALNRSSDSIGVHPSLEDKDNKEPSFKIPKTVNGVDVVNESKLDVGKIDQEVCSGVYKIKPSSALDQVSAQEEQTVHEKSKHSKTGNLDFNEDDGNMCACTPKGSSGSTGDHPSLDDKDNKEPSINISMPLKGKGVLVESSLEIGKIDQEVCSGVYKIKPSSALNKVSSTQEEDAVHDNSKHGTTGNLEVSEGDGRMCSNALNKSSASTGFYPRLEDKDNKEPSFKIPKPVKGVDVINESKLDVGKIDQEVCSGVYKIKPSSALDQVSVQKETSSYTENKENRTNATDSLSSHQSTLKGRVVNTGDRGGMVAIDVEGTTFEQQISTLADKLVSSMKLEMCPGLMKIPSDTLAAGDKGTKTEPVSLDMDACENDPEGCVIATEDKSDHTLDQLLHDNDEEDIIQRDDQHEAIGNLQICKDDRESCTDNRSSVTAQFLSEQNDSAPKNYQQEEVGNLDVRDINHETCLVDIEGKSQDETDKINIDATHGKEANGWVSDNATANCLDYLVDIISPLINVQSSCFEDREKRLTTNGSTSNHESTSDDFQGTTFQQKIYTLADKLVSYMKADMGVVETCRGLQTHSDILALDEQESKSRKEFSPPIGLTAENCKDSRESSDMHVGGSDQKRCAVVLENKHESNLDQLLRDEDIIQENDSSDELEIIPLSRGCVEAIDFSSRLDHQLDNLGETIISVMKKNLHNEQKQGSDSEAQDFSIRSRLSRTDATGNTLDENKNTLIDMTMDTYLKERISDKSTVDVQGTNLGEQRQCTSIMSMISSVLDDPASDVEDNAGNANALIDSYDRDDRDIGHDADQRESCPDAQTGSSDYDLNHPSLAEEEQALDGDRYGKCFPAGHGTSKEGINQNITKPAKYLQESRDDEEKTKLEDDDTLSAPVASEDWTVGRDGSTSTVYASSSIASGSSSYDDDPSSRGLMYKIKFFNNKVSSTPLIAPSKVKLGPKTALVSSKVNLFEELAIQERLGKPVSSSSDIAMDPLSSGDAVPRINTLFEGRNMTTAAEPAQHMERSSHVKSPIKGMDIKNKVEFFEAMRNGGSYVEENPIKKRNKKTGGGKFAKSKVAFFEQFNETHAD